MDGAKSPTRPLQSGLGSSPRLAPNSSSSSPLEQLAIGDETASETGIVSRLVNLVSSPVRNHSHAASSSSSFPPSVAANQLSSRDSASMALMMDGEEVTTSSRRVVQSLSFSPSTSSSTASSYSSVPSGESQYYSPMNGSQVSLSAAATGTIIHKDDDGPVKTLSQEDLYRLNRTLQMTDISSKSSDSVGDVKRGNISLEAAVKLELLQDELHGLQTTLAALQAENGALKDLIVEYEQTMSSIIESRKDPGMPQGWPEERRHLLSDLQTLQITMQNVQQRHDDLRLTLEQCKQQETTLRQQLAGVQGELTASERRYEVLRRHAEDRISDLTGQVQRDRAAYEDEVSVLRAKLSKTDLRVQSLEANVEAKARENSELVSICDQLISKMDSLKSGQQ